MECARLIGCVSPCPPPNSSPLSAPPRSPMWWCPSCLSMRWTSSTRCRDTCWTWMTRQAPWLPWQRLFWLAVSPPTWVSLAGATHTHQTGVGRRGALLRDYYLQADLSQTYSYHRRSILSCGGSPRINARCPPASGASFSCEARCPPRANPATGCIYKAMKWWWWICCVVFWRYFCYAKARVASFNPFFHSASPFSWVDISANAKVYYEYRTCQIKIYIQGEVRINSKKKNSQPLGTSLDAAHTKLYSPPCCIFQTDSDWIGPRRQGTD